MRHTYRAAWLAGVLGSAGCFVTASSPELSWERRFTEPPAGSRILKIIHGWPDEPAQQDQWIGRLRAQGFGGVVCNVSFQDYLESEVRWQAFTRAVKAAKEAGFAMWLYDERGYPSGNAGGLVLRDHPEWEARGLLVADTETTGGAVSLDLPPGTLRLAAAFPVRAGLIDQAGRVELASQAREGSLTWTAPPGHWRVMAITEDRLFTGTHAAGNYHQKLPYPNLLMPEPTARFIELTYGGYARHLGSDLSRYFDATFTDEPSLMSLFLEPMPYRPLPWASNLPAEFQRRRGYPLETAGLPLLVADAGAASAGLRHDFWLTVGELVSENYFGQIQTRTRELGLPSGGHLLAEEGLVGHVPLYGDFFRCVRRLDAPSIDCLTSVPAEVPWHIARLVSSAAELEGRTLVMSETSDHGQVYRPAGDTRPQRVATEAEIRGTCNRLIVAGVNTITSYFSFAELSDEQLRRLNDWVGRCCAAVRGGHQVADIAVVYPVESIWTRFVPSRHWSREAALATQVEAVCRGATESLFAAQRDFTFVDSRALSEAVVDSGTLVHGPLRWRVVVLPGTDTLPLTAWRKLAEFARSGGVVIALGALPANSEREFPSAEVEALARTVFGPPATATGPRTLTTEAGGAGVFLPRGSENLLPFVLAGVLEPDVTSAPPKSPVRATHRRIEGREVYFVVNDSVRTWSGSMTFAAAGNGERWDPATGRREAVADGEINLTMGPYEAAVFRYDTARRPARRSAASGVLPGLSMRPVPRVEPTVVRGEFVRAEIKPVPLGPTNDTPAWEVRGVLTRGSVDTFLFSQFHFPESLDLSAADCLLVETEVPSGQSTPNQLLVILRERDGGDFLVETGRALGTPGQERTFIPWERFQLAGWSKDPDGVLDLRRIQDLRIGWGGYLGTEGEQVRYRVALPQTATLPVAGR